MMRNLFVWGFLAVFAWQLLGYSIYFEWKHFLVKKEIKKRLKRVVPPSELIDFHFSSQEISQLNWLEKNEFEWNGHLFDVVQSFTGCDRVTHLRCISDTQEKALFKELNNLVASNLDSDQQNSAVLKICKTVYSNNFDIPLILFESCSTIKEDECYKDVYNITSSTSQPLTPPPNLSCLSYRC